MENAIKNKVFVKLINDINDVVNQFKSINNDVNQNVYDKYQLNQEIVEGNDEDVLQQYKTMYDTFLEVVINKNNAIQQSNDSIQQLNDMIEYIKKVTDRNDMKSIINKEMNNVDEMVKFLNQIVDKIIEMETTISYRKKQEYEQQQREEEFKKKQHDIKHMKLNYYNTELQKQQHNEIKLNNDIGLEHLNNSIKSLKKWSNKQKFDILFDSDIDGNGGNNVLMNKVMNKENLYFILFYLIIKIMYLVVM